MKPGERVARRPAEQTGTARLCRDLNRAERRSAKAETALVMGEARALLERVSESPDPDQPFKKRW